MPLLSTDWKLSFIFNIHVTIQEIYTQARRLFWVLEWNLKSTNVYRLNASPQNQKSDGRAWLPKIHSDLRQRLPQKEPSTMWKTNLMIGLIDAWVMWYELVKTAKQMPSSYMSRDVRLDFDCNSQQCYAGGPHGWMDSS